MIIIKSNDKRKIYSRPSLVIEQINKEELGGFYPYVLKQLDNGDIKVISLNEEIISDDNKTILDDAKCYAYFCPVSYNNGKLIDDRAVFACITDNENRIVAYEVINGFSESLEDYINENTLELTIKRS